MNIPLRTYRELFMVAVLRGKNSKINDAKIYICHVSKYSQQSLRCPFHFDQSNSPFDTTRNIFLITFLIKIINFLNVLINFVYADDRSERSRSCHDVKFIHDLKQNLNSSKILILWNLILLYIWLSWPFHVTVSRPKRLEFPNVKFVLLPLQLTGKTWITGFNRNQLSVYIVAITQLYITLVHINICIRSWLSIFRFVLTFHRLKMFLGQNILLIDLGQRILSSTLQTFYFNPYFSV